MATGSRQQAFDCRGVANMPLLLDGPRDAGHAQGGSQPSGRGPRQQPASSIGGGGLLAVIEGPTGGLGLHAEHVHYSQVL